MTQNVKLLKIKYDGLHGQLRENSKTLESSNWGLIQFFGKD